MTSKSITTRDAVISIFVLLWLIIFNYESVRHFYLERWFHTKLPKIKFLFPPAGWIMFYNVDDTAGFAEIYGIKDGKMQFIDPHLILETRTIGFDNIHRNILSRVLYRDKQKEFGDFLKRKFPYFDGFVVMYSQYPSLTKTPHQKVQQAVYQVSK